MRRRVNANNIREVFARLLKDEGDMVGMFAERFDQFLDELCAEDFFGTEGQLDPRPKVRR